MCLIIGSVLPAVVQPLNVLEHDWGALHMTPARRAIARRLPDDCPTIGRTLIDR